ncbi:MAG: hypothetical protein LBS50_04640 [Prevotellaceae bacterium]|jgi:hypothetical protein|nr:hypothetical protein [Prevotellaceae bacterium]
MIENLKRLHPDTVERFLHAKNTSGFPDIPVPLAAYILQINDAFELNQKHRSISDCARELQKKYPDISFATARQRVYDAISYFYTNNTSTAEHWNNVFADRMEKLHDIALVAHDFKEARICTEKAREYRLAASAAAVNPDMIKFKEILVSPDIWLERFGIQTNGIEGVYKKAMRRLEAIDITATDKERLGNELKLELFKNNAQDLDCEN